MLTYHKQIAVILLLASLLLVTFSSLAMATHGSDDNMANDCPFSSPDASPCPQDLLAATIHHLSAYYSFFNVPLSLGSAMIVSLLLILYFVLISLASPPIPRLALLAGRPHTSLPVPLRDRKITYWLSLLENSPALL